MHAQQHSSIHVSAPVDENLLRSDLLALLSDEALTDQGRSTQLDFLTRVCAANITADGPLLCMQQVSHRA
jgi:hypothetical protein